MIQRTYWRVCSRPHRFYVFVVISAFIVFLTGPRIFPQYNFEFPKDRFSFAEGTTAFTVTPETPTLTEVPQETKHGVVTEPPSPYSAAATAAVKTPAQLPPTPPTTVVITKPGPTSESLAYCASFPDLDDILIVVKTGATEAISKIPTQLLTFLQCLSDSPKNPSANLVFFSDMEQDIGTHHIYDSLDTVLPGVKNSSDFDLYRLQQEFLQAGQDVQTIAKDHASEAWNLDKYKNLHIAEKSYHMHPDKKWYLFIDADTYVIYPSLVKWLERLDPEEELYLGSAAYLGDVAFGHGGSGYILSRGAMKKFFGPDAEKDMANTYDERAKDECCGDLNLAKALQEQNLGVTNVWPTLNGEKPRTIPFGSSHWCHPIVTMHHMSPDEVGEMWLFEQERVDPFEPLLLSELYHSTMGRNLNATRADWDNYSDDVVFRSPKLEPHERQRPIGELSPTEQLAHLSFANCGAACIADKDCFAYSFRTDKTNDGSKDEGSGSEGDLCSFSKGFKMGSKRIAKDGVSMSSGWDVKKIKSFVEEMGSCWRPQWPGEGQIGGKDGLAPK